MRVFVTGATGFVGSHVLRLLVERGEPAAALVRPGSDRRRIADLEGRFELLEADLDRVERIAAELRSFAPEVVVHLAWEGVGNRYRDAPLQLERNLPRTVRLVEVAADAGAGKWVGMGSQAEYGPADVAIAEDRPPRPTTLYGEAKLTVSKAAARLCDELGMDFAWLRLFSVYGPMDEPGWLIPMLIRELLAGGSPPLTAGTQRWDYLYVTDVAEAVLRTAAERRAVGVFNLGSGEPRTVRSIAEAIRDRIAPGLELRFGELPFRNDQILHLEADTRRLREATGWRPRVPFDAGITQTIEWFRDHDRPDRATGSADPAARDGGGE